MNTYTVSWVIEVDADNAVDAAKEALLIQRDPESTALVFDVNGVEVDLCLEDDLRLIRQYNDDEN